MASKYKHVDEAKAALEIEVNDVIAGTGVFTASTCPTGEPFGWDMMVHYALEWFLRHCPTRWHIDRIYRHECYDWTITAA